jgi:hypothetical protein
MLQPRGSTVILPLFIVELNSAAACGLHTVLHTPRRKQLVLGSLHSANTPKAARAQLSALR